MDFSKLKDADIILFHTCGFSPISIAIRTLTESFWNHCGAYVKEGDQGYVIEALFNGVVKTPIEKYIGNTSYELKAVRFNETSFRDQNDYLSGIQLFMDRLYLNIGKKYDFMAIAWLGIKYIWKGIWKKVNRNPLQHRSKFFCSELICTCANSISSIIPHPFEGTTKSRCDSVTPKDIGKSEHVEHVTGIKVF